MNTFLLYSLVAQMPQDAVVLKQFADEVSQKDFRWWFAIIFGILIMSGTFVFKWLIGNLREQRDANTAITKDFIGSMQGDRLKMMVLIERVTMVLEKLEEDKRLEALTNRHQQQHQQLPS